MGPILLSMGSTLEIKWKSILKRRMDSVFSESAHCIGISWLGSDCAPGKAEPAFLSGAQHRGKRKGRCMVGLVFRSAGPVETTAVLTRAPFCPGLSSLFPYISWIPQSTQTSALILMSVRSHRDISNPCCKGMKVYRWPFLGSRCTASFL